MLEFLASLQTAFEDAFRAFAYRPAPIAVFLALSLPLTVIIGWRCAGPATSRVLIGGILHAGTVAILALACSHGDPFVFMNALALAVFVQAPALHAYFAARLPWRWPRLVAVTSTVVALAVALEAFVVEPRWLVVRQLSLTSSATSRPLKLALLADLQFDHFSEHERRALKLVMDEHPDAILLAGDYVQLGGAAGVEVRREANAYLRTLRFDAPLGVYAVQGNVESDPRWVELFNGLEVETFTKQRRVTRGPLSVTAFGLMESYNTALTVESAPGFHVALGHVPNFALGNIQAELLVAGHTHGGQVQLPFIGPLVTFAAVPRAWSAGEVTALPGGRTLLVSRGVGMERGPAPRLRFRCRPEVVFFDIQPATR